MRTSRSYKCFIKTTLFISNFLIFITVAINFGMDPLGIHQTSVFERINKVKTETGAYERAFKAIDLARKKPKAVLLGSSRVAAGFNPLDVEKITDLSCYNAALSAATFEEVYHYFDHILYHQPDLKVVILGIDFFSFRKAKPAQDFTLSRLKNSPVIWKDFCSSLLSWQMLHASYLTFAKNFWGNPIFAYYANGQANPMMLSNPDTNYILAQGEVGYLKNTLKTVYNNYEIDEKKIELFQKLVRTCEEQGIDLKVFFCPSKVAYWETLYRANLWNTFENLKRRLVVMHPIWDFSGYSSVTTQVLESEIAPLYFECSHFQPCVGKFVLEKMFQRSNFPSDFGYYLTQETIEEHLSSIKYRRIEWLKQKPPIIEKIEKSIL